MSRPLKILSPIKLRCHQILLTDYRVLKLLLLVITVIKWNYVTVLTTKLKLEVIESDVKLTCFIKLFSKIASALLVLLVS